MIKFLRIAWMAPLVFALSACGDLSEGVSSHPASADSNHQGSSGQSNSDSSSDQYFAYVTTLNFKDDGTIPNNPKYPVLLYHGAVKGLDAEQIIKKFEQNNWGNNWVDGIFDFHHFHSTSHEVLGIAAGHGEVQLGGPKGKIVKVTAGDVVVLPAGTGHKRISASRDFSVVGGYPDGRSYDTQTKETPQLKKNISKIGKPSEDPVYGNKGPLLDLWKN
ncbi:hypothetical protein E4665_15035 [Sporolactobacillus shoreae]|uniref:Cupin domain-containing protein n=1 Tax=Sporolactobacillus shoreae TaxID=1465501 RepID=A0A4Z0GJX0_9BACL|nr:hypothetical protein [Sporolactobacillus shoreae]TGA96609.1 hypothetical protein E4665_15035 [Sporolactobacillus shoreae]